MRALRCPGQRHGAGQGCSECHSSSQRCGTSLPCPQRRGRGHPNLTVAGALQSGFASVLAAVAHRAGAFGAGGSVWRGWNPMILQGSRNPLPCGRGILCRIPTGPTTNPRS